MSRTIPELDILIEQTKTKLSAFYTERRQLREAKKPRWQKASERMDIAVDHFRSGMSRIDIAKTMGLKPQTIDNYIRTYANDMAYGVIPEPHGWLSYDSQEAKAEYITIQEQRQILIRRIIRNKFNEMPVIGCVLIPTTPSSQP